MSEPVAATRVAAQPSSEKRSAAQRQPPHLALSLNHRLGSLHLHLAFTTRAPWTVLFGPSGSGKTTVLRAIAGLQHPEEGRIVCEGHVLLDTAARVMLETHRRGIRWAAQTAMLFPHMTVRENLAFGCGTSRDRVDPAMAHFQLEPLADRRPAQLSGGERQRIGVIRAALAPCRLLLLDEPFTGLDRPLRDLLIEQLRTWLGKTPVLSVTHDIAEPFLLEAEVIRIAGGRVLAQGAPADVLAEERRSLQTLLR